MKINQNNFPPFAEEQSIPEEQLKLQEFLNQLEQPIPSGFVELGQPKKYWGSTEDLKEPICERYSFKHDNKLITLDIPIELNQKLELTTEDNFYVIEAALTQAKKEETIITIKNEEEIFLNRSLTINNLELNITRWLSEIKQLKTQIKELKEKGETSQATINNLHSENDNSTNRITELEELLNGSVHQILKNQLIYVRKLEQRLEKSQNKVINSVEYNTNLRQDLLVLARERKELNNITKNLREWKRELKFSLVPLFWPTTFYTEDTPTASVLIAKVKKLVQEKEQMENERDDCLKKLEQKGEIIKGYLQKIENLEREKERLKNENNTKQQELTQKANEIITLRNKITKIERERDNARVQRDNRPNITLQKWNTDYKNRLTQQQLSNLQTQLDNIKTELNTTKKDRDSYYSRWDNHRCPPCERIHCIFENCGCDCHPITCQFF